MACKMKKPRRYVSGGIIGDLIGIAQDAGGDIREDATQADEYGRLENKQEAWWNAGTSNIIDPTALLSDPDANLADVWSNPKHYLNRKENRLMGEASLRRQSQMEAGFTGTGENPYTPLLPYGGMVGAETVELEKGEPYMYPDGRIESIPDDAPSHKQGGVVIDLPHGTKVLGKKNKDARNTFKKLGKKLERLQKVHEKKLKDGGSKLSIDTSKRMLDNIKKEYNDLFVDQGEDITPSDTMAYGGQTYADGGVVTTQRGVSNPNYRNVTPTTFHQQLQRKGVLQPESDTLSVNDIQGRLADYYGNSSPYRVIQDDKGNPIYQKDYGRNVGEYYDESGSGDIISTYNKPRSNYGYGGAIRKAAGGVQSGYQPIEDYFGSYPNRVRDFQSMYNLKTDGIIGDNTRDAWDKYGSEYIANSGAFSQLPEVASRQFSDTDLYSKNAAQPPSTIKRTFETPEKDKGWNSDQWAGAVGSATPIAYNLYQSTKSADQLNPEDYYNPYEADIRASMRSRRYNINPELEQTKLGQSTYNRKLRESGASQQQYLSGLQGSSIASNRARANAVARKQNMDSQYIAEQAQMDAQLGAQRANTLRYIEDVNARNRAAQKSYGSTAASQLGQYSQVQQQMANQRGYDEQLLNLLPSLYPNYQYNKQSGFKYKR